MGRALFRCILILCVIAFVVSGALIADYYLKANRSAGEFGELARLVDAPGGKKLAGDQGPSDENAPGGNEDLSSDGVGQSFSLQTDRSLYEQTEVSIDPRILAIRALAERNADMVGWVRIDDTLIDYPVMQSKEDAEYYLHRNFEKQQSDYGTPFVGPFCDVDKPSDNILIYGHHMKNGSMFAGLMDYESRDFFERHQIIHFDTLNELGDYQIIAVFKAQVDTNNSQEFEYFLFTNAEYPDVFDEYIANVKGRALYDTGHSAGYGDKLITLSTCEYTRENGRMVVVARRIVP